MKRISPLRSRSADTPALLELKTSLRETQTALDHAHAAFDYTSDPELTEACIYEIRSLQARMNYLLRQIKELEVCAATAVSAAAVGPKDRRDSRWAAGTMASPGGRRT